MTRRLGRLGGLVLVAAAWTAGTSSCVADREAPAPSQGAGAAAAPVAPADDAAAIGLLPDGYRSDVAKALAAAGANRSELVAAIRAAGPDEREAMAFLIAHMPPRDLGAVRADLLVENVQLACRARREAAWGKDIPDEVFLNDVVPYANLNERRDQWRADFYKRFMPVARACRRPAEAVLRLNQEMFPALRVAYHATKRPKPDQSPYESIEAGYASCTGLSVLLADACRAIGIPARVAGTPLWTTRAGNHTWVEVWDREWRFVGAAEPAPLDTAWFVEAAAKADPAQWQHRIYAASWAKTGVTFPLVWDLSFREVAAVDVTRFYTARRKVRVEVLDRAGGRPARAEVTLRLDGRTVARDLVDGAAEFILAGGLTYEAAARPPGGARAVTRTVALPPADPCPPVVLPLQ